MNSKKKNLERKKETRSKEKKKILKIIRFYRCFRSSFHSYYDFENVDISGSRYSGRAEISGTRICNFD